MERIAPLGIDTSILKDTTMWGEVGEPKGLWKKDSFKDKEGCQLRVMLDGQETVGTIAFSTASTVHLDVPGRGHRYVYFKDVREFVPRNPLAPPPPPTR
jgi:hypothetical protein